MARYFVPSQQAVADSLTSLSSVSCLFANLPLDTSQSQLRLWQFDNDDPSKPIRLTLKVYSQDPTNLVPYIALSYVWGSTTENLYQIEVNGNEMTITKNLWEFLTMLRSRPEHTSQLFWADQISLDQTNTKERDHQVALMGSIFSEASHVFTWLGPMPSFSQFHSLSNRGHPPHFSMDELLNAPSDNLSLRGTYDEFYLMIAHDMVKRDYWSRLWIVQEVTLARELLIFCGDLSFSRKDFIRVLDRVPSLDYLCEEGQAGKDFDFNKIVQFTLRRKVLSRTRSLITSTSRQHQTLSEVLRYNCAGLCSDRRDKIYGLQALVIHAQRVNVDYSKSYWEVFDQALRLMAIDAYDKGMHKGPRSVPIGLDLDNILSILEILDPNFGPRRLKSLLWALHAIHTPKVLAEYDSSEHIDLISTWSIFRDNLFLWGITKKQNEFMAELNRLTNTRQCEERWRRQMDRANHLSSARGFAVRREILTDMLTEVKSMIEELAARFGFVMYGAFLGHPDEWPFPAELPSKLLRKTPPSAAMQDER